MVHLQQGDGNACAEEIHRDAPAHGSCADDRHFLDLAQRRVLRHIGNLGCRPFAEESMPQRARLRRLHELQERFALEPCPLFIRHGDGGRDGVDAFERRGEIFRGRADRIAGELEECVRVGETHLQVTHALQRTLLRHDSLGERDRPRQQIPLEHFVEQRAVRELLRRHGIA